MILPSIQGSDGNEPHPTSFVKRVHKNQTVAERAIWMTRTSDELGSHMKKDIDSYLTLIKRKIQEKCGTTMELITQIRRNKIGETSHVTPNEFRFTLIKFGIILEQPLVDKIFNVFDSDRSGTMDFDEFAMWIMNSEYRPVIQSKKKKAQEAEMEPPLNVLRKNLLNCIQTYRPVFDNMKPQISINQFIADILRKDMNITEKEARTIFQLLDPRDCGFIYSSCLIYWAETGKVEISPRNTLTVDVGANVDLKQLILSIFGGDTKNLDTVFKQLVFGKDSKLTFDELRRCMVVAGAGKNLKDVKKLFVALGGLPNGEGVAQMEKFFQATQQIAPLAMNTLGQKKVVTNSPSVASSRADRRLRDALRKSFREVKNDMELSDPQQTGFIDSERLHRILVRRCMPMSYPDFRLVTLKINKQEETGRIDIQHFLYSYHPSTAPHMLDGSTTLRASYDPDRASAILNESLSPKRGGYISPSAQMVAAIKSLRENRISDNSSIVSNVTFQGSIDDNASIQSSNSLKFARPYTSDSYSVRVQPTTLPPRAVNGADDIKHVWQSVLRECHRSDPDRTGQVNRMVFISAIENANARRPLNPEIINRIVDNFATADGLINYLQFFRNYLNDMSGGGGKTTGLSGKSQSMSALDKAKTMPLNPSDLKLRPLHPWDFDYKREKKQPYWNTAASNPKDLVSQQKELSSSGSIVMIPPPNEKSAHDLSASEKSALLSMYEPRILRSCALAYKHLVPYWRNLRNEFKRAQISNQRGCIMAQHFVALLDKNGISNVLSKNDLGGIVRVFRAVGMQEIVKFDEFLRVCMLVKDFDT